MSAATETHEGDDPEAVVRQLLAAIDRGDWERVRALVSDDFAKQTPIAAEPIGRERWLESHRELHAAFPDLRHNADEFWVDGEEVGAVMHITGTHTGPLRVPELAIDEIPPSGRHIDLPPQSDVFTVRDGKVVAARSQIPAGGGVPGMLEQIGAGRGP